MFLGFHCQIPEDINGHYSPTQLIPEYRQTSNINRTKLQNLNVSRLVLKLSLCNLLMPGIKSRMKI